NVSPPLRWKAPPRGTRTLALLLVDPDAPSGAFTHWTLWNLPPTRRSLPLHFKWKWQGRHHAGAIRHTRPRPPAGPEPPPPPPPPSTPAALSRPRPLARGPPPSTVVSAVVRNTRATATLVGTYSR